MYSAYLLIGDKIQLLKTFTLSQFLFLQIVNTSLYVEVLLKYSISVIFLDNTMCKEFPTMKNILYMIRILLAQCKLTNT